MLESRHETRLYWDEPWEACGPQGNELTAHVTISATVHDCVNLQRAFAKSRGKSVLGNDREFLLDFMTAHYAYTKEGIEG